MRKSNRMHGLNIWRGLQARIRGLLLTRKLAGAHVNPERNARRTLGVPLRSLVECIVCGAAVTTGITAAGGVCGRHAIVLPGLGTIARQALRRAASTFGQSPSPIFSYRPPHRAAVNIIGVSIFIVSIVVLVLILTTIIMIVETVVAATCAVGCILLVVQTQRGRQGANVNERGGETLRRMRRYRVAAHIAPVVASACGPFSSADFTSNLLITARRHR